MGIKMTTILGVTIAPGDIVKIKFRKLEDVLRDKRATARLSEIISHYNICNHMDAFVSGGHFEVREVYDKDTDYLNYAKERRASSRRQNSQQEETFSEISIVDHKDSDGNHWRINDFLIESISVENDSVESYFSEKHQLSLVYVDNTLFINGEPLTAADSKISQMFEKVLAEAAINNVLCDAVTDEDEDKMNF